MQRDCPDSKTWVTILDVGRVVSQAADLAESEKKVHQQIVKP
jgi:hypothetical protein